MECWRINVCFVIFFTDLNNAQTPDESQCLANAGFCHRMNQLVEKHKQVQKR